MVLVVQVRSSVMCTPSNLVLLTLSTVELSIKKSRIQLQRELLRPSRFSLFMSCCGIMVLNAELKSMNSILTY